MKLGPFKTRADMRSDWPRASSQTEISGPMTLTFPRTMPSDERERWIRAVAVRCAATGWTATPRTLIADCRVDVHDGPGVLVQCETVALRQRAA